MTDTHAQTPPSSLDLATLVELNRDYIRAVQTSDVRWFEQALAPDFLCTNADGSLVDRVRARDAPLSAVVLMRRPDRAPTVEQAPADALRQLLAFEATPLDER
jgi:hypothetical protein